MLLLVLICTVHVLPMVCGRYVDATALKEDLNTMLSGIESKKAGDKRVNSNHGLDGNINDEFQLNNMLHLGGTKEGSHQSSTSSSMPSSTSTLSTILSKSSTSSPLSITTTKRTVTDTKSTVPTDPTSTNKQSAASQTGSSRPITTPSFIASQTTQPQSVTTTRSVEQPVTSSTVKKTLKTEQQTTSFVTTTGHKTTGGKQVSVFRMKKAITSDTEKTTVSTSPTTSATSVPKKKPMSKCEILKMRNFPLPDKCKKSKTGQDPWT